MPATDLARVKGALHIPVAVTVHDQRLGEIVGEVDSDLLEDFDLDSWDAATTYTETLDVLPGTGGYTVVARRFPIRTVVALTASLAPLVQGADYRVDRGGVIRLLGSGASFESGRGTVEVTYTAGHVVAGATPSWLVRLATMKAALQYNVEPQIGIATLTVDPVRKQLGTEEQDAMQREIARLLARWSKPAG